MLSKIGFGALEPVGLENWRPPRDCALSQGCINLIPIQATFMYVGGDQVQSLEQPADDVMDLAAGKHYLLLQAKECQKQDHKSQRLIAQMTLQ